MQGFVFYWKAAAPVNIYKPQLQIKNYANKAETHVGRGFDCFLRFLAGGQQLEPR